ncbi:MAG TPA: FKBP-type peptidyl-prolyl cis-trans isomerase, partial [Acidimicrobiales bacterium]
SVEETTVRVVREGDGEVVTEGATVGFDYIAVNGRDGNTFDKSYGFGTQTVVIDRDRLIPGLVKGLVGAKVGSQILVAMPPDDAFGPRDGVEELGIEADDTIMFLLDVVTLRHPLARAEGSPVDPVEGLPSVSLDDDGEPSIDIPDADPPTQLVAQTLIEGTGPAVEAGQTITVHYSGEIWESGEQFDSSWERGEPASFPIGNGSVIPGWDNGLVGKTVGSQVLLVVPPADGYGEAGNPNAGIGGNDTLVFVVDILDAF